MKTDQKSEKSSYQPPTTTVFMLKLEGGCCQMNMSNTLGIPPTPGDPYNWE